MILPDVNLLVYAYDSTSRRHEVARIWWEGCLNGSQMIGLPWVVLLGFIRLLTNPRIFQNPYSPEEVLELVGTWLELPHIRIIHPSNDHFSILSKLIREAGIAGNLTTDAHLAAVAIERGLILQTTDADFTRFSGLKWVNPLREN